MKSQYKNIQLIVLALAPFFPVAILSQRDGGKKKKKPHTSQSAPVKLEILAVFDGATTAYAYGFNHASLHWVGPEDSFMGAYG